MSSFAQYAENIQPYPLSEEESPTFHALSRVAKEVDAYIVGGSIPGLEVETGKVYNTTLVFGREGSFLGHHRKAHLFDIDIKGHMTFCESYALSAGNKMTVIDLPDYGRISLGICYDVRFPEPAMIAARQGVFAMIYPSVTRGVPRQKPGTGQSSLCCALLAIFQPTVGLPGMGLQHRYRSQWPDHNSGW